MKISTIGVAALLATVLFIPACRTAGSGGPSPGEVALLLQDLRDVAQAGTVYALAERPEFRPNITVVRDQLEAVAKRNSQLTYAELLSILQGLPVKELRSSEALLSITAAKIILRRAGPNEDFDGIGDFAPVAKALADGITEGLSPI